MTKNNFGENSIDSKISVDDHVAAEKKLAELLGWKDFVRIGKSLLGEPPPGEHSCRAQGMVPWWSRNWADGGPLLAENQIGIEYDGELVTAKWEGSIVKSATYDSSLFENKNACVLYAGIDALSQKLEALAAPALRVRPR